MFWLWAIYSRSSTIQHFGHIHYFIHFVLSHLFRCLRQSEKKRIIAFVHQICRQRAPIWMKCTQESSILILLLYIALSWAYECIVFIDSTQIDSFNDELSLQFISSILSIICHPIFGPRKSS